MSMFEKGIILFNYGDITLALPLEFYLMDLFAIP